MPTTGAAYHEMSRQDDAAILAELANHVPSKTPRERILKKLHQVGNQSDART